LEDKPKPWKLITTLKEREIRNLKQAAKDRQKKGSRVRPIPDEADLESLRASNKQRREERKLGIIQERQKKLYNAELKRLEKATARKKHAGAPKRHRKVYQHSTLDVEKGARPNVLNRVKDKMSTIWPITAKTEFADREVTELFKIRYPPLNPARGVDRAQYHALQMNTEPGEEEGTTIKKTVLLERLNPAWMGQRFDQSSLEWSKPHRHKQDSR
jgi:hypothetical protein